jgi:ribosomal protein S18 acetylase RimI-like enzyme
MIEFRPFTHGGEYRTIKSIFANAFTHTSFTRADIIRAWSNCDPRHSSALYDTATNTMMGFILIRPTNPDTLYISFMAIDEKWRGGGHGTAIMKSLMQFYQDKKLNLEVVPVISTLKWYKSLGFKRANKHLYVFHHHGTREQAKHLQ